MTPAVATTAPSLADTLTIGDVARRICSRPGGSSSPYRVRLWLSEHNIPVRKLGGRTVIERAAVEAALGSTTHNNQPAQAVAGLASDWVELAAVAVSLFGKRTKRTVQRTRRWLLKHSIPLFRPARNVALVSERQVKETLAQFGYPPVKLDTSSAGQRASIEAKIERYGSLSEWGRQARAKQLQPESASAARPSMLPTYAPPSAPERSFRKPRTL